MKNIKVSEHNDPLLVTVEILRQWLHGKGKEPVTWRTLVTCLQATDLNVLSEHNESEETKNLDRDHPEL